MADLGPKKSRRYSSDKLDGPESRSRRRENSLVHIPARKGTTISRSSVPAMQSRLQSDLIVRAVQANVLS